MQVYITCIKFGYRCCIGLYGTCIWVLLVVRTFIGLITPNFLSSSISIWAPFEKWAWLLATECIFLCSFENMLTLKTSLPVYIVRLFGFSSPVGWGSFLISCSFSGTRREICCPSGETILGRQREMFVPWSSYNLRSHCFHTSGEAILGTYTTRNFGPPVMVHFTIKICPGLRREKLVPWPSYVLLPFVLRGSERCFSEQLTAYLFSHLDVRYTTILLKAIRS